MTLTDLLSLTQSEIVADCHYGTGLTTLFINKVLYGEEFDGVGETHEQAELDLVKNLRNRDVPFLLGNKRVILHVPETLTVD